MIIWLLLQKRRFLLPSQDRCCSQSGEVLCKPESVTEQAARKSPPLPPPSPAFGCTDRLWSLLWEGRAGNLLHVLISPHPFCCLHAPHCSLRADTQSSAPDLTHTCCCPGGFTERAVLQLLHFPPVKLTVPYCVELLGEGEQSS